MPTKSQNSRAERSRILICLSPVLCPVLGFMVGVMLSFFLPPGVSWGVYSRLLMVCFGLLGWAIGACFVQKMRLHCGATRPIEDKDWQVYSRRYFTGTMIVFTGFILATIGLLGAAWSDGWRQMFGFLIYFLCLPTTLAIMVGEMGWGKPLKFLGALKFLRTLSKL